VIKDQQRLNFSGPDPSAYGWKCMWQVHPITLHYSESACFVSSDFTFCEATVSVEVQATVVLRQKQCYRA